MLSAIRDRLADLSHWLADHRLLVAGVALVIAAGAVGAYLLTNAREDDAGAPAAGSGPAPRVVVREVAAPEETEDLGFPRSGPPSRITRARSVRH